MAWRTLVRIACVVAASCGSRPAAAPVEPARVATERPAPVAWTFDGGNGWPAGGCLGGAISDPDPELVAWMREQARLSPPRPWSLTTVDGEPLSMRWLLAHGVVDGPLTFTELRFRFDNHLDRAVDARLALALPPGASLGRLARKVGDAWIETSETTFALAAREEVELIVAYLMELADPDAAFELPHDDGWRYAQVTRWIDVSYEREAIEHVRPRSIGWQAVDARSGPGTGFQRASGAPGVVAIRALHGTPGKVKVDGAEWVWPTRIDDLEPGAGVMIYAGFRGNRTPERVVVRIGREKRSIRVDLAEPLLVEHAAARARGDEPPGVLVTRGAGGVETLPR